MTPVETGLPGRRWAWWVTAGITLVFLGVGILIWAREERDFKTAQDQNDRMRAEWDARLQVDRTNGPLQREVRESDRLWRARYFHHLQFQRRGINVLALTAALAIWALHRGRRRRLPTVRTGGGHSPSAGNFFFAHRRKLFWALLIFAAVWVIPVGRNALRFSRLSRPSVALANPSAGVGSAGGPAVGEKREPVVWGAFRGNEGNGISGSLRIPTGWDGTRGESVVWTSSIPYPGNSSPIVVGDRVILTGATRTDHAVWACDLATGREIWRWHRTAQPTQPETVLEETGFAAPTPATDGRVVAAIFADGDVVGLSLGGRELWRRALGVPENMYGHASSLVFAGNQLMVQWDQGRAEEKQSRLLALDPLTGATRWETLRPVNASWATPLVIRDGTGSVVVLAATPWVIAYEAETGRERWRAEGMQGDVAPSPVSGGGRVYALNAGAPLVAIRLGGTGDVTATHVDWSVTGDLPDTCSPLVVSNRVFTLVSWGILTARDAETGRTIWEKDLGLNFTASPALADGRLYLVAIDGTTVIAELADEYREIARCSLGEPVHASPVFGDGWILLRGRQGLWRIGGVHE